MVAVRDVVAPVIVSVSPAAGSVGVDVGVAAVVRFSEPLNRSTVTAATLRVTRNGTVVPAAVAFSDADRTVTLCRWCR